MFVLSSRKKSFPPGRAADGLWQAISDVCSHRAFVLFGARLYFQAPKGLRPVHIRRYFGPDNANLRDLMPGTGKGSLRDAPWGRACRLRRSRYQKIRFARQVTDATFTQVIVEARRKATESNLPAENQQSNLLVAFDPMAGMQARQAPAFGTFFQRFNAAGAIEEELRIERNFVAYRTGVYDRWAEIGGKLDAMVLPLAQLYAAEVPLLESAVLQYVDRFVATGQVDVDWSELYHRS